MLTPAQQVPRPLTPEELAALERHFPSEDLDDARIYDGVVPWYLPKRYRAIARGNRIYLRPGVYQAGSAVGLALLAHELVHVGQYRAGATWLSFLLSYLRHGYCNSPLEVSARQVQERIRKELQQCGALEHDASIGSSRELR